MRPLRPQLLAAISAWTTAAFAAEPAGFTVAVTHDLPAARPAETIVVPFAAIAARLPEPRVFHVQVRDLRTGAPVPAQFTNFAHDHKGVAWDQLVWQHDFAAGERRALFRIERSAGPVPPMPPRVFARYVPERHDDFAWENDRIAHRVYGPALDSPAAGRERLRSSGLDIWAKRVRHLVVDRWYLKGHDQFHLDDGEGVDAYHIGPSRGAGGTGVWADGRLHTSGNFAAWRVLANGPLRAVFELDYAPWEAGGVRVAETKRFTVDAGRNIHAVESTFTFAGPEEITVGIGITLAPNQPAAPREEAEARTLTHWHQTKFGHLGIGIVLQDKAAFAGFAREPLGSAGAHGHAILLARVRSGVPLRYRVGAGWDRSGDFADRAAWETHVAAAAARAARPTALEFPP